MAQRFLALPLMRISWFRVADFDVLEDPDLSDRFELYCSRPARLLDHDRTARPAERFSDSGSHSRFRYLCLMEQRAAQLLIGAKTSWQKISKLHSSVVSLTKSIFDLLAQLFEFGSDRFLSHSLRTASAEWIVSTFHVVREVVD
jgi:hypothetical protein